MKAAKTGKGGGVVTETRGNRVKAFLYLQDPSQTEDPHGLQDELYRICWRCVTEDERRNTPPYGHAKWCPRYGYEDQRTGGPNDPYQYEGYAHTNYHQ